MSIQIQYKAHHSIESIKKYIGSDDHHIQLDGKVRTLEYCIGECKSIIDQLIEIILERGV